MYFDKVRAQIHTKKTRLCLGLDPDFVRMPPFLQMEWNKLGTEAFLERWTTACLAGAAPGVAAVKFQSAFFEAWGEEGQRALKRAITLAREQGLPVILDAKRGDISSTMHAYGRAAFEHYGADCLTVTPYLGLGLLSALDQWLTRGHAIYIVWVSSNPDAGAIQDVMTQPDGVPFHDHLLRALQKELTHSVAWQRSVGLVLGATRIDEISAGAFDAAKQRPLLLPGFGAQGAVRTERIDQLNSEAGAPHLFPMSRALTDLPFMGNGTFPGVATWSEYEQATGHLAMTLRSNFAK